MGSDKNNISIYLTLLTGFISVVSISRVEQTCKHLQTVIRHARIWRKLLLNVVESEPRLVDFIPQLAGINSKSKQDQENNDIQFKFLFAELKTKLDKAWATSDVGPSISR